jgi:hypothetical protein
MRDCPMTEPDPMNAYEIDVTAIRAITEHLIANGEDGYPATLMAMWIVKEGLTIEAARERVGDIWLD